MSTIFTRAKAAKRVIELFDHQCGIPRSELHCDARLESDLGVVGDDTYELLEAMHRDGVDMTDFDCYDRITPEGTPALPMLIWTGAVALSTWGLISLLPTWPSWSMGLISLVGSSVIVGWMSRFLPNTCYEELRVRDLVLSIEAGHWISPKAEANAGNRCSAGA